MKLDYLEEKALGPWKIMHFTVSKEGAQWHNLGAIMGGWGSRRVDPGEYTKLRHAERGVVMSNTPAELRDLWPFTYALKKHPGRVRIHGLGLGIAAKMALDSENATSVLVVEIDPDVIDLVGNQLQPLYPDKLTIVEGDVLQIKARVKDRYAVVWHDIWDTINLDNWEEYKLLHRRWGRACDWQGSWGRSELEYQKRQDRYW